MRLISTIVIFSLFSLQSFSQAAYFETKTAPTSVTINGTAKAWSTPLSYSMSGGVGASNLMVINDWKFTAVPTNALSITGVVLSFNYANASNITLTEAKLVNSTSSSSDLIATNIIPSASGSVSFGTSNGLNTEWGNVGTGPLSAADISTIQFGVSLNASKTGVGSGKLDITSISLTVYFTASLPVTLSKFDVSRINGDQVSVNWETSSESNVDMLYVERSRDGRNFSTLFEISPRGKQVGYTSYNVTDRTPFNGANFYRIRERDADGLNRIYTVQRIDINSVMTRFVAKYNQPTISVELSGIDGNYQVSVAQISGQLISRTPVSLNGGNGHLDIDASSLRSGIYLVNLSGNGINKTEKILIAK